MIPQTFDYVRARNIGDALKALAAKDGAKVIAGGHSLIPIMRFRLAQPSLLVDIGHLPELRGIAEARRGAKIGAGTTYRELLESALLTERFPVIAECTSGIGDLQVRNKGTIGGGLAHADPAADLPAVMLALDAQFVLRSKRGKRTVAAREFFQGSFSTAMAEDELMVEIVLPPPPRNAGMAYVSFEQAASGYALAGAAAIVKRSRATVAECALAMTGVSDRAYLVKAAEQLVGTKGEPEAIEKVAAQAADGVEVNGDIHAPADYRRHLATVAARQALQKALVRCKK